jgi:aminodeoxyfutalosine deaminase
MKLLKARHVVPVGSPVIAAGAVLIENGRIRDIGPASELINRAPSDVESHDLGDMALLPGFINPHTHLELTCYKDALPRAPLWEWFNHLLPKRFEPGAAEREIEAVRDGARQSIAAGVTLVGDISRSGITAKALVNSPIRRISFVELISGAKLPPSTGPELEQTLSVAEQAFGNAQTIIGISPHAPYTVIPDDLRYLLDLARRDDRLLTIHLLETSEEVDWLEGKPGFLADFLRERSLACADHQPTSAVEFLSRSGLLDGAPRLAHVNYVNDALLDILSESRASIAYCPRAHAYFGHKNHPWKRLRRAGINVCIGTDSLASNASLSILDELRYLAVRNPDIESMTLLEMGTINSATALHLEHQTGQIKTDAWADLCAIPCNSISSGDVVDEIIRGKEVPQGTWIAGELVSTHSPR